MGNPVSKVMLEEKEFGRKIEIMNFIKERTDIFFDNTVIFKTELLKLFLDNSDLGLNENLLITACLLCNCKKADTFSSIEEVHMFAKKGAEYLAEMGFDEKFCRICEQVNRYSGSKPREPESDVLEIIDQFGGMLLDRPERIGLNVDEALVLLEFRNLKDKDNRYLKEFKKFVNKMEAIKLWV